MSGSTGAVGSQPLDPATTVTVLAGGFSPAGATRQGTYGVDEANTLLRRLATLAGRPVGADDPLAPNQVTEATYYGDAPPAYYSAQDIQDIDQSPPGTLRYARIVAKHAREVLRRSGAAHVNLAGASYGGIITRTVIELDLEGLASSGRIARWLTLEGTQGGVYVASQIGLDPALVAALAPFFDATDATTMTYDFVRATFGTPTPQRSLSPLFSGIQVGFHVSGNHDYNQQLLRIASGEPNDGLLLARDQVLELDARPDPLVVITDTTHDSARNDDGLAVDVVNFMRSSKRVRVKLLDVTRRRSTTTSCSATPSWPSTASCSAPRPSASSRSPTRSRPGARPPAPRPGPSSAPTRPRSWTRPSSTGSWPPPSRPCGSSCAARSWTSTTTTA
ncbi:MAG: hypothetical protein R3F62_18555 [Planctomycetota bacterium]